LKIYAITQNTIGKQLKASEIGLSWTTTLVAKYLGTLLRIISTRAHALSTAWVNLPKKNVEPYSEQTFLLLSKSKKRQLQSMTTRKEQDTWICLAQ